MIHGGNEIILANWPENKYIICNVNNDIPVTIPCHPYVLVNRSVLCNCRLEAEKILLEYLAACHNLKSKLIMYFTVNMAPVNYLDSFDNLTETLEFPVLYNSTTHEQTLLISLQSFGFDSDLLNIPKRLKDCVCQFLHKKGVFDLEERYITDNALDLTNKNSFLTIIK